MDIKTKTNISQNDIIWFLFRSLFGKHFTYIYNSKNTKTETDIIKGCLHLAWNDAFRHIQINTSVFNSLSDTKKEEAINKAIDSLINPFKDYVSKKSLENAMESLKSATKEIKDEINIGITQKFFNMAVKYYYCIYMFREELGIEDIVQNYNFSNADCPIDKSILNSLNIDDTWSQITCIKKYNELQSKVSKASKEKYGCENRLLYDFKTW